MTGRRLRARPGSREWRELAQAKCVAKRQFQSAADAEQFALRYGWSRQHPYECPFCGLWHLTKQAAEPCSTTSTQR